MSSILDALKKAEQQSTAACCSPTPWPAPPPALSIDRHRTYRWWMVAGLLIVLGVGAAVVRQLLQPEATGPAPFATSAVPPVAQNSNLAAPLHSIEWHLPATTTRSRRTPLPLVNAAPVQPVREPTRSAIPEKAQTVQPPAPAMENRRRQPIESRPEPVTVSADVPIRRAAPKTEISRQPVAKPPESAKNFRNDPRIELQALVWASEAVERFVVINDRLVKEGGAVDNIVVMQINRDDVLLSEGSNQWHVKFKID